MGMRILFGIIALGLLVIAWSVPVILIDEVLKLFGRAFVRKELAERLASEKKTK